MHRLSGRRWAKALLSGARVTAWLDKRSTLPSGDSPQAVAHGTEDRPPPAAPARSWVDRVHGLALVLSSLMLLSPLPLPFSNTLPGWAVFLLAAGQIKRNVWIIFSGYAMATAAAGYLTLVGVLGKAGGRALFDLFGS
jgi:hypothetical protein